MFKLDGRTALVTGAGLGAGAGRSIGARIDFGIASALAAQGARVLVNDIDPERIDNAVHEIERAGGSAIGAAFDVVDREAVDRGFAQAAEQLGPVDILVNNAGLFGAVQMNLQPFLDTAPEDWRAPIDANLFGAMNCTRAALPGMVERVGVGSSISLPKVVEMARSSAFPSLHMARQKQARLTSSGICRVKSAVTASPAISSQPD